MASRDQGEVATSELAKRIAEWATHELGFRKSNSLIRANGYDEELVAQDVEAYVESLADRHIGIQTTAMALVTWQLTDATALG
ncbi:hypothetical protein EV182_006299, partial [Spiromyces aspiralis]